MAERGFQQREMANLMYRHSSKCLLPTLLLLPIGLNASQGQTRSLGRGCPRPGDRDHLLPPLLHWADLDVCPSRTSDCDCVCGGCYEEVIKLK